uniref:Nop domain-containing protein n=1 Tax=Phaeomonas parva TaxID=124430 RepID=A0A7S1U3H0_9STRA|mmetsp:Transcript_29741/g.95172  ORF Transcript_29741/g.95172 Transcript_29741/m.95172 type:complete len:523 (+) Transcript_29741:75-1643(+)|eukprot:CAMPEP_0118856710 /NCGR_PEP_ID=MMETSP1163-20130328/4080_1 /TAXON_ID=124430 /ORGANISM="Phaeomonas parva, Strain CCMP2877" /LENGTH=522 /DNA_ID=CAMNT_0006789863 /DNA_START=115 /DNA_END=1683 /DNA_ORIENTATION=+
MSKGLQDDFLDDLDDLGGSSDEEEEAVTIPKVKSEANGDVAVKAKSDAPMSMPPPSGGGSTAVTKAVMATIAAEETLESVAKLRRSRAYREHMAAVDAALEAEASGSQAEWTGPPEQDPSYQLVVACNEFTSQIEEETAKVFRFVADQYAVKFPELESLVSNPLDFAKTVSAIGNEMDLTNVDLNDILPSATVMVVSVTGSTTAGVALRPEVLAECLKGCEEVNGLDADRRTLLSFVEGRMMGLAPNVCALIGAQVAARLLAIAGGLNAMSRVPSCNLQVLGQDKAHTLAGFSNTAIDRHMGIIGYSDLCQSAPPYLRMKALKVTAAKVVLAARTDAFGGDKSGDLGLKFRQDIEEKIEKWQEPTQGSRTKALPKPDPVTKKRRGGRRARAAKERFKITELAKEANRSTFGNMDTAEYGEDAMGLGFGQLGSKAGSGRLRAMKEVTKTSKLGMKRQRQAMGGQTPAPNAKKDRNSGISSSLVFTPVQGLELVDPTAEAKRRVEEANKKWFNASSGFLSAKPK